MDGVVLRECLKATEPLWGDSFFFTTKFLEIHGTHFIDLRKIKGCVDLRASLWIWTRGPWIGNPV